MLRCFTAVQFMKDFCGKQSFPSISNGYHRPRIPLEACDYRTW